MTVIAAYNHFGCGIVVGDILISGPVNVANRPPFPLPTLENAATIVEKSIGVRKLEQKVCIISKGCALAWAGRLDYARKFIRRLKRLSDRIRITKDIVARIFYKCSDGHLQVAGAIYEDGQLQTFGLNCTHFTCPTLGQIYAGGSGKPVIAQYTGIVKDLKLDLPNEDEVAARGVSLALTQVTHLLNAEFRKGSSADSIRERFGGGYEIAAYYDGQFRKVSANFVFLDVSYQNEYLKIDNPKLIISQTYCGETLRYRILSAYGPENSKIQRNETITVPDLLWQRGAHTAPSVEAPINFACFVFVDDFHFRGRQLVSTIVKSDNPPFDYYVAGSELNVVYSEPASQHIKQFLIAIYNSDLSQ